MQHALLSEETGIDLWVKHENHNPTSAFKVRGGLNLVRSLAPDERRRGVVTASTGNHGQSIALACQREGVRCTVFVPDGNNPEKNAAMRAFGAIVDEGGRDFDEARERCERAAADTGARYVHSANEPLLIAGVATYALEIFERLPDVATIVVPIGGGSGACGNCLVRSTLGSSAKVIGVQAEKADAFTRSFRSGTRVVGDSADTFAEGMATRVTFDLTFSFLAGELDDIVVLSESELAEGVRLAMRGTHNLAEGAGASALAAAVKIKSRLNTGRVVAVMSGGNLDAAKLKWILSGSEAVKGQ
jgi:threonine dehydratase